MFIERKASKGSLAKRKLIYGVATNDASYSVTINVDGVVYVCPFYSRWVAMLRRCYSVDYKKKKKTYEDCYSCDSWLLFSCFKLWMETQDWKGKELDKDILIKGNKMYSPGTCLFVTTKENSEKSLAKEYKFLSPDKVIVQVYNLNKFCRDNGLEQSAMSNVHAGKNKTSKGWGKG
tara:strand:+ start:91 stop:618 length:528 start_codon:yes stop_codon:yes gene_type:complete